MIVRRTVACLLVCPALCADVRADTAFAKLPVPVPFAPGLVRSGDLDGNGTADLVVSAPIDGPAALAVLLGTGDGAFGPPVLVPVGTPRITALELADLDADGDLDVVAPGFAVLLGHGDGTFDAPLPFLVEPGIGSWETLADLFALGDLDEDGVLDYAAVFAAGVHVGFGRGDGTFVPQHVLQVLPSGTHRFVALVDLLEDGHLDVVAGAVIDAFEAGLWVFEGDGTGRFGRPTKLPLHPWNPVRPALADFDGDGHLDVAGIGIGPLDTRLVVALGHGDGSFGAVVTSEVPKWHYESGTLRAIDLDGVAPVDLVASGGLALASDLSAASPAVVTLTAQGGGHFGRARTFLTGTSDDSVLQMELADLDGDGAVDLVLPLDAGAELAWMVGDDAPFVDLGKALAGPSGTPSLAASGVTTAGEAVTLAVGGVPAAAGGLLLAGFEAGVQPFHGGTLVPVPEVALPVVPGVPLTLRWPDLPVAGTPVYVQAWLSDGGAVAASNALAMVGQ